MNDLPFSHCCWSQSVTLTAFGQQGKSQDLSTFSEVARVPRGMEWLWHPQVLSLYNRVLQQCDINATSREAAAGALQNITAGDKRVSRRSGLSFRPPTPRGRTFYFLIPTSCSSLQWASVLSQVALEQERILPVLLDRLRTTNDLELRSLTGLLRNLSRHARDKNDLCKYPTHFLPPLDSVICLKPQVAITSLVPNCSLVS